MDIVLILVIVVVLGILGGMAVFAARGAGLWSAVTLPSWVSDRGSRASVPAGEVANDGFEVGDQAEAAVTTPTAEGRDASRNDLRAAATGGDERLARLEDRLGELFDRLTARLDDLGRELAGNRQEEAAHRDTTEARQEAALERLRADLTAAAVGREADGVRLRVAERRTEVTAELYARLARLEAAVAAVTNPVLLPGEPYAPPAEFLAEALAWENWKDVGERAFAFADCFSAQRLYLTESTCAEMAAFVTTLRSLLTRSVYPNLSAKPGPTELQALRTALDALAAELPRVRRRLEAEFRSTVGAQPDGETRESPRP